MMTMNLNLVNIDTKHNLRASNQKAMLEDQSFYLKWSESMPPLNVLEKIHRQLNWRDHEKLRVKLGLASIDVPFQAICIITYQYIILSNSKLYEISERGSAFVSSWIHIPPIQTTS